MIEILYCCTKYTEQLLKMQAKIAKIFFVSRYEMEIDSSTVLAKYL